MEQIDDVLENLNASIKQSISDLSKITDLNQKKTQAEIIKLLCDSMGVFLNAMNNMRDSFDEWDDDYYDEDDYDDYDEDDDDDYEVDIPKKKDNKKKSKKDDDIF